MTSASQPRSPKESRPRALALVLGVALTALLALVAIASGSGGPQGGGGRRGSSGTGVPPAVLDYLLTTYAIVMALGAVLLVYALWERRHVRRQRQSDAQRFVRTMLVITGFCLVAWILAQYLAERRAAPGRTVSVPTVAPAGRGLPEIEERPPYRPQFRWAPVVVVGVALAAGAAVVIARRRRRGDEFPEAGAAAALSEVVDEALDDLWRERDPRRAVIAAYARMERVLAAHGSPRKPFEAPLEYLARVLTELQVRAASVLDLTQLFERAKFSRHEIDRSMKEDALVALASIRDDLRASAAR